MIEQIGLNTTINLTELSFDFTGSNILSEIPTLANQNTNHWLAMIILATLWLISYITFADRTQFSEFKYNDARATTLAFGVCSIFGITNVQIGFYTDLKGVMFFITLFMLSFIAMLFLENKE